MPSSEDRERLLRWFEGKGPVLVAYSGGTDSTLVLHAALEALGPDRVTAALAVSSSLPRQDLLRARETARSLGAALEEIRTAETGLPAYRANGPDRCYHCRTTFMEAFRARAGDGALVVEGGVADDAHERRPGSRAMQEGGARAPLRELGLPRDRVRALAAALGLPTPPSGACLASRIPFGEPVTPEKMAQVDRAEEHLREEGFALVRVRHHGAVARIEVEPGRRSELAGGRLAAETARRLRALGFSYVSLDLEGYREGSLHEALEEEA